MHISSEHILDNADIIKGKIFDQKMILIKDSKIFYFDFQAMKIKRHSSYLRVSLRDFLK